MTSRALEQGCSIEFAACYFEVWMLRLAGVFPDLFYCAVCRTKLAVGDERVLAAGLQAVICSSCDHRSGVSVRPQVLELLLGILKNPLENGNTADEKALENLHELNEFWIRQYFGTMKSHESSGESKMQKYVYFFGGGKAEGKGDMKDILGGKGAGLAEMTNAGVPVPPGFTISTEVCKIYYENKNSWDRYPDADR